ncbi:MAG: polysaccharide deacetylase family protein [Clostridia bacterium]|nr:polysaccharide deacetylase family protein [Clostridia bacterium]MBR3639800.1 polysaccharide deacetylase family protein [Clostridia bacterium]
MKKYGIKILSAILALIMFSAVLVSCMREAGPGGAGRVTAPTGTQPATEPAGPDETETAPATETETNTEPSTTDIIPPPSGTVSRPADLSAINAIPRDFFPDAANDGQGTWYMGKTVYDAATGEISTVFERDSATLETLEKYGGIYLKNPDQKVVYLTFDCGYENGFTPKILDVLKEKNAKGIFFVTGAYIDTASDIIRRMLDEGHLVGTHTNNHKNMALLSAEEFIDEILSNEEKLKSHIPDAPDMIYYRPPMGATSEWALAMAQAMGLTTVMWSWTQYDYDPDNQPDPYSALENAKSGLRPGCVYLLHAVSATNASILGDLIDFIRAQGYEIRRMDQ